MVVKSEMVDFDGNCCECVCKPSGWQPASSVFFHNNKSSALI